MGSGVHLVHFDADGPIRSELETSADAVDSAVCCKTATTTRIAQTQRPRACERCVMPWGGCYNGGGSGGGDVDPVRMSRPAELMQTHRAAQWAKVDEKVQETGRGGGKWATKGICEGWKPESARQRGHDGSRQQRAIRDKQH